MVRSVAEQFDRPANAGRKLWFEEILMYYNTLEFRLLGGIRKEERLKPRPD